MSYKHDTDAVYLRSSDNAIKASAVRKKYISFICFSIVFSLLSGIFSLTLMDNKVKNSKNANVLSYADDCDGTDDKKCTDSMSDSLGKSTKGVEDDGSGGGLLDSLLGEKCADASTCNGGVSGTVKDFVNIFRVLAQPGYYLNGAPNSTIGNDEYKKAVKDATGDDNINCFASDKMGSKKTGNEIYGFNILYHNCDVPNQMTELIQGIATLIPSGMFYAHPVSAYQGSDPWGIPSYVVDNKLQMNASNKFTGLERFGYNINYTAYLGEWDNITVPGDEWFSDFGLLDHLTMWVGAAVHAIGGIVQSKMESANLAFEGLKSGDILKLADGVVGLLCLWCGAQKGLYDWFDTINASKFAGDQWYRPGFGDTMYNTRELTADEIAQKIAMAIARYMLKTKMDQAVRDPLPTPAELSADLPEVNYKCRHPLNQTPATSDSKGTSCLNAAWEIAYPSSEYPEPSSDEKSMANCSGSILGDPRCTDGTWSSSQIAAAKKKVDKYNKKQDAKDSCKYSDLEAGWNTIKCDKFEFEVKPPETIEEWWNRKGLSSVNWPGLELRMLGACARTNGGTVYKDLSEVPLAQATGCAVEFIKTWAPMKKYIEDNNMEEEQNGDIKKWQQDLLDIGVCKKLNPVFWKKAGVEEQCKDQKEMNEFMQKEREKFGGIKSRYVCLNADGTQMGSSGNWTQLITREKDEVPVYSSSCLQTRMPIQNGLFGNGYKNDIDNWNGSIYGPGTYHAALDTRRQAFGSDLVMKMVVNSVSNMSLYFSSYCTRISNLVLDLAFSPILKNLGIEDLIVVLITSFRDSLFFPLSILAIMIFSCMVFWQAATQRAFVQQFRSLMIIGFTFILGCILLYKPATLIKYADEGPALLETLIAGTIFDLGPDGDNLCQAEELSTGTTDPFWGALAVNPADLSRKMECENWRAFYFGPYVYGQWGTSYDQLYSHGHATGTSGDLNTSSTIDSIVGDARVDLGGGQYVNNWALYQLSAMSGGTTTQPYQIHSVVDDDAPLGSRTSSDVYRVVDAQAGPANGQFVDGQYFDTWSLENPSSRMAVMFGHPFLALIGAITVIMFAFAKIQISVLMTLMLVFMPFMLLIGLHPTTGRSKLKGYFAQLFSLMAQRVLLVTLLAMMLRLITAMLASTSGFLVYALMGIVVCLAFLMYRKRFTDLLTAKITSGGGFGGEFFKEQGTFKRLKDGRNALESRLPTSMRQSLQSGRQGRQMGAAAALGALYSGGSMSDARKNYAEVNAQFVNRAQRKNQRQGLGGAQRLAATLDAATEHVNKKNEDTVKGIVDEIMKETPEQKAMQTRLGMKPDENGNYESLDVGYANYQESQMAVKNDEIRTRLVNAGLADETLNPDGSAGFKRREGTDFKESDRIIEEVNKKYYDQDQELEEEKKKLKRVQTKEEQALKSNVKLSEASKLKAKREELAKLEKKGIATDSDRKKSKELDKRASSNEFKEKPDDREKNRVENIEKSQKDAQKMNQLRDEIAKLESKIADDTKNKSKKIVENINSEEDRLQDLQDLKDGIGDAWKAYKS